jgi:uncharacterized protein (DUF1778 family)
VSPPEKPDNLVKTKVIKIRVTEDEERAFKAAAAALGVDLSVFVRMAVREKIRRERIKAADAKG